MSENQQITSPRPSPQSGEGDASGTGQLGNGTIEQLEPANTLPLREDVARKAKELLSATAKLEQAALFEEPEFEEALLWSKEKIRKTYNAEHSKQIELRQDTAAYMLKIRCPKEHIAKLLRMNTRLIEVMAANAGPQVAGFSEEYANMLLASGAADFALAEMKKHDANYLQLVTGGAIKTDKALAIKSLGGGGPLEGGEPIDLEQENPNLAAARKFLENRRRCEGSGAKCQEVETLDVK